MDSSESSVSLNPMLAVILFRMMVPLEILQLELVELFLEMYQLLFRVLVLEAEVFL